MEFVAGGYSSYGVRWTLVLVNLVTMVGWGLGMMMVSIIMVRWGLVSMESRAYIHIYIKCDFGVAKWLLKY